VTTGDDWEEGEAELVGGDTTDPDPILVGVERDGVADTAMAEIAMKVEARELCCVAMLDEGSGIEIRIMEAVVGAVAANAVGVSETCEITVSVGVEIVVVVGKVGTEDAAKLPTSALLLATTVNCFPAASGLGVSPPESDGCSMPERSTCPTVLNVTETDPLVSPPAFATGVTDRIG